MRGVARLAAGLVALALVALALVGCGVPPDDRPRALDPAQAPAGALPSAGPAPETGGDERVELYFLRGEQVVPVTRPVAMPTSVPVLLELLLAGPTATEKQAGATSLIPATLSIDAVEQQGTVAVVTLRGRQDQVRPQALAFAQIVATLTPERASGVRFRLDGADLPVPRADGSLTDAPVSRADYAPLLDPTTTPVGASATSASPPPSG